MERGNFEGDGWSIVKYRNTAVCCTKTAEAIKMPFELLTQIGPRNRVLDGLQIPQNKGKDSLL